jgi:hypothetical protein
MSLDLLRSRRAYAFYTTLSQPNLVEIPPLQNKHHLQEQGSNICSCKLCPVQVLPVALHMCECRCTSEWQNLCKVKLDVWVSKLDVDILGCSCRPFSVCVCLVLEPGTEARAKSGFAGALLGSHNSWHAAREKEKKQDRLLHSPSHAFECDPGYQHL